MNRQNDNERLLADVLTGADAAGFREALFGETLRLARRRRHFRQARKAGLVTVMLMGIALLVWRTQPPQSAPREAMQKNYSMILSQPLPAAALVTTRRMGVDRLVASSTNVQLIQTAQGGSQFREISDDELLALAEPKPAALVRLGPHTVELVVLSSTEQEAPSPN